MARVPAGGHEAVDLGLVPGVDMVIDAGLEDAVKRDCIVAALNRVGASLRCSDMSAL